MVTIPKTTDIKKYPKDEIINATVLIVEIKTWKEMLTEEQQKKFVDNSKEKDSSILDNLNIIVNYQYKFDDQVSFGNLRMAYMEKPSKGSTVAKFLTKYGELEPGTEFRLNFNIDGVAKLQ